jgi:hypothetical protein
VQLSNDLCTACQHFFQTDNDVLDLLTILEAINSGKDDGWISGAIHSMREAIKRRNPYVSLGNMASSSEVGRGKAGASDADVRG